ncbi:hypothetical protein K7432_001489 [Basidiobolus ranarum]|uniref:Uncharacterized protein n=1 Tax=Basidiobolus ranarum TaxID=34480 RepID=A0ABR2X2Z8_9FUNG
MSESDSPLNVEASSSFIQRLDSKIKAYRQELQAVKEYHQTQKESISDRESDVTEISRASPSILLESFEKLTLNERLATPPEVSLDDDQSLSVDPQATFPSLSPTSGLRSPVNANTNLESLSDTGDTEEIDPMYLQPYNEYTEQYDIQDGECTPDDTDSLCNSIQYSEHTHILDVEPPTFSVYGEDSVYEAPLSSTGRRRSQSLYQNHSFGKSHNDSRSTFRNREGTIYEDDYLDKNYMSVPPLETHGYISNRSYRDDYSSRRNDTKHWSPFIDRETKGYGPYQDEFDSITSRRSPSPYGFNPESMNKSDYGYSSRSPYYNTIKGSSHDDLSLLRSRSTRVERGRIDFDLSRTSYDRIRHHGNEPDKYDMAGQPYNLRDDVSSKEGSVDTSTLYSPRHDEFPSGRRSLVNSPSPNSPNLRHQSNRHSLLDRYDNDALRRSRSNLSDFVPNSAHSPMTSPRDTKYRSSPRVSDARRIPRAPSPSTSSLHATRSLTSERSRRNRHTISNLGDLRSEYSSQLSSEAHYADRQLSDTTSQNPSVDARPRKINEVKFEIFRAVHRVKMALDTLAEDSRTRLIASEIQRIQDLNELALQTMIEQFEHVHEMFGEGEGSVGTRRPISPLSDESYGKLITHDSKKYGIVEDVGYRRQASSEDMGSRYTRSDISSPNLHSRRLGHSSRIDRNSYAEPPLSPSPSSRISRWQSLMEDSKSSSSLTSRLRGASAFEG